MIYYPLSTLMFAGITEILVISTPEYLPAFQRLLSDGSRWGISFSYAQQDQPRGLADAFIVGREFVHDEPVCLILGDNIFFGHGLPEDVREGAKVEAGAMIFAYRVRDPGRYGVVEFDETGHAVSLEEKPDEPRSQFSVPGMYFYDGEVTRKASKLQLSERGELEITDLNRMYMAQGKLKVRLIGRGVAWLDAGTHKALMQAGGFVQAVQDRQGLMIACPEEIAYRMGFIDAERLWELASEMVENQYKEYLKGLVREEIDPKFALGAANST
jgi:glucose-1-phosphate thymidylyltransferase